MRERPGSPSTTRTATSPTRCACSGSGISSGGSGRPAIPQVRAKARSITAATGPAELDPGVAPGGDARCGVAGPLVADAHARDGGIAAVDRHHLAVVAAQQVERVAHGRRGEGAHPRAGVAQWAPEALRRGPAPEPVVQHPHLDAVAGPVGQRVAEHAAGAVVAEDVVLQVDPARARPRWRPATPGTPWGRPPAGARSCPAPGGRRRPAAWRARPAAPWCG